jgi:hypothetical protein
MLKVTLAATLVLFFTVPSLPDEQAWLDRGAEVLAPFKEQLKGELMEGMKKGTANAIDVCSVRAPEIAKAVGSETVLVGRTSHKLRNPGNAPRAWVEPLLRAYVEDPSRTAARAVALEGGGVGYVEPIMMAPMCLTCHGESMTDATRNAIAETYPDDQATGFANGDFRGLFWIEFRKE